MGCRRKQSCRELIIKLGILPLSTQYIFSLLLFLNENKNLFAVNSTIYQYATRQQSNLHQPLANLSKYQKGICYLGVKVFNKLPPYIKEEGDNLRKFKRSLFERKVHLLATRIFWTVKINNVNMIMLYSRICHIYDYSPASVPSPLTVQILCTVLYFTAFVTHKVLVLYTYCYI